MTRINVIPVNELTDNFLMAEYFELPRIYALVAKHRRNGTPPERLKIPSGYVMGKGHMTFFYDKLAWLYARQVALGAELLRRRLPLNKDPEAEPVDPLWFKDTVWWGDYTPDPDAVQLNRNRLQYRRKYDGGEYQGSR